MAQMISDALQGIYNHISNLGKSISNLQESINKLNELMNTKIQKIQENIEAMTEIARKEGETFGLILKEAADKFVAEVKKLQSEIGLKDLEELTEKLKKIAETSEEALKPETVDVLLDEVLRGIKNLMGSGEKEEGGEDEKKAEKQPVEGDNTAPPPPPSGMTPPGY